MFPVILEEIQAVVSPVRGRTLMVSWNTVAEPHFGSVEFGNSGSLRDNSKRGAWRRDHCSVEEAGTLDEGVMRTDVPQIEGCLI